MPIHTCETCGYTTNYAAALTKHKARKNPCTQNFDTLFENKLKAMIEQNHPLIQQIRQGPVLVKAQQSQPVDIVKPFLKWVGGKTQLIDDVIALFPNKIRSYHEPFLGGGSVLLAVLSNIRAGRLVVKGPIKASDINANLINLYKNIQSKPDEFIAEVNKLSAEFSKATGTTVNRKPQTLEEALTSPESYYFWTRTRFNALADRTSPSASAAVLFMNKTCFRGVYREGPNGFNVPFGNYKNPTILDEEHIRAVSTVIKDVLFTVQPFTAALSQKFAKDDFVYLDPPYAPENTTSFVSYTADGFDLDAHNALFTLIKSKKTRFLLSNADVPLVRTAFPEPTYKTKTVSARRAINSKNPEAKTNEVLITN